MTQPIAERLPLATYSGIRAGDDVVPKCEITVDPRQVQSDVVAIRQSVSDALDAGAKILTLDVSRCDLSHHVRGALVAMARECEGRQASLELRVNADQCDLLAITKLAAQFARVVNVDGPENLGGAA